MERLGTRQRVGGGEVDLEKTHTNELILRVRNTLQLRIVRDLLKIA